MRGGFSVGPGDGLDADVVWGLSVEVKAAAVILLGTVALIVENSGSSVAVGFSNNPEPTSI